MISNHWQQIKLGQVATVISGFAFKSAEFQAEGVPVIKIKNIRVGTTDVSNIECVSQKFCSLPDRYHVKGGDLLISLTGSHLTQPTSVVGRVAIHPHYFPPCLLNQRAGKIMIHHPVICNPKFLFYALSTEEKTREIALMAHGAASQANISPSQVENISIFLPSIHEQWKVVSIISAYDEIIENNTRRIQVLEEMARNLYREWFVNFRFPGHENVRMMESENGPLPEGWEWKPLGLLAREVRRSIQPTQVDPETPYVGLEHLPRRSITLSEWGAAKEVQSTKLAFRKGEILFGKIRPYFHKVGVAPVDGVCSSDTIVIVPQTSEAFGLVVACVSSDEFVAHATRTSQGTKMPRADWSVLVNYLVPVPDKELLSRFDEFVRCTVAQLQNLMLRNRNLRQTRDLLLPRLISGNLDVAELEIAGASNQGD